MEKTAASLRARGSGPSLLWAVMACVLLLQCGSPTQITDSGGLDVRQTDVRSDTTGAMDAGSCTRDIDCTDGVFCNGVERCMPGGPGADIRGCAPALTASPCLAAQRCVEASARCESECDRTGDADGDGHRALSCGGDDCDDGDAMRFPGHPEVCDPADHDEDCERATFGLRDDDGDGYFDARCCNADSAGLRTCGADCDDARPNVHPGLPEACDGVDNDCNRMIDDGVMRVFFRDADGDGFGDAMSPTMGGCTVPVGYVENGRDCDDTEQARNPGAPEVCDGLDNNCDGTIDERVTRTLYVDADGDGFGSSAAGAMTMPGCFPPEGWSFNHTDCDDANAGRNPGAPEVCDFVDNDCNTRVDDGFPTVMCYPDADGDGYGLTTAGRAQCRCQAGWITRSGDCADDNGLVNPAQTAHFTTGYTRAGGGTSFDYNCNGAEEGFYQPDSVCSLATNAPDCAMRPSVVYEGSAPACGAVISRTRFCSWYMGTGIGYICGAVCCGPNPQQACR